MLLTIQVTSACFPILLKLMVFKQKEHNALLGSFFTGFTDPAN